MTFGINLMFSALPVPAGALPALKDLVDAYGDISVGMAISRIRGKSKKA
jgi:hypothetical protein